jgi:hypothetical protein
MYNQMVDRAIVAGANDIHVAPNVNKPEPAKPVMRAKFFASATEILPLGMGRFFVRNILESLEASFAWFSA